MLRNGPLSVNGAPVPAPSDLPVRDSAAHLAGKPRSAAILEPAPQREQLHPPRPLPSPPPPARPYIFVNCQLNKKQAHYALIDISAPTIITWSTLCNVIGEQKARNLKLKPVSDIQLEQWNGQLLPVRGKYQINFRLGSWCVKKAPVLVTDHAPSGFVIGNDLISRGGTTLIDWEKRQLEIGGRRPVDFATSPSEARMAAALEKAHGNSPSPTYTVHLMRDTTLAPRQATFVTVSVRSSHSPLPKLDEDFLFGPDKAYQERHHVHLAEGIMNMSVSSKVFATNGRDRPLLLKEGAYLGTLTPIKARQPADSSPEEWQAGLSGAGLPANALQHPRDLAAFLASTDNDNDAELMAIIGEKDRTDDSVQQPPGFGSAPKTSFDKLREQIDIAKNAPPAQRELLFRLISERILFCPPDGVGLSKAPPVDIRLKPGAVVNNRNYGLSNTERQREAMAIAQKMEAEGIIRKSTSQYNSPVVLARKADGTWRFCVDYRQINAVTERDGYQLPRTSDLLNSLGGAKIFSVLDLASAFWQIRLAESAQQYTAFSLLSGHWEFCVLPMGMSNSPAIMQRALEGALGDILYRGALAYIDDIIVYGATWEEHNRNLEVVLERLREYGFHTRPDKCRFGYRLVKFLGHVVGEHGIRPWEGNLAKIRACAVPTDTKQLESALALFSYYRRFVPRYASLARPLIDRLTAEQRVLRDMGKNPRRGRHAFTLTANEVKAFEELKARLTADNNLLALPELQKPFVLESDSSDFFGHVTLSQYEGNSKTRLRPVAFHSFRLPAARWKKGAYEREFYCVIEGVRYFSNYLDHLGRFEVRVDQQALRYLHTQARTNPSYGNWVQVLSPYEIKWVYQPAGKHRHIDCFTRPPFTEDIAARMGDAAFIQEQLLKGAAPAATCALCRDGPDPAGKCNMRIHGVELITPEQDHFSLWRGYPSAPSPAVVSASAAAATLPVAALLEEEEDPAIISGPEDEDEEEEDETDASTCPEEHEERAEPSEATRAPVPLPLVTEEVKRHQREDLQSAPFVSYLEALRDGRDTMAFSPEVKAHATHYVLGDNGLLYYVGTGRTRKVDDKDEGDGYPLVIPQALRKVLLEVFHVDSTAGHLGYKKAHARMARQCYWPNMLRDLMDYEKNCASCMEHKLPRRGTVGTLHPISTSRPWEMVGMDILGPMPRTRRGYSYVIVFMDYFTRYVIVRPLRTQTAPEVARTLVNEVFLDRAPPARLLSDRGATFLSDLLTEVYKYFGVLKVNTSAYHPQTDGMVERFNHTVVAMLAHYVGSEQDDWDDYLRCVQFAYNTAVHATMGYAPHTVMHGWDAPAPALAPLAFNGPTPGPLEWRRRMEGHINKMSKLVTRLDKQAKQHWVDRQDAASHKLHFVQGQLVWRKREARGNKLEPKLDGPYYIVQANVDNDTYLIRKVADGPKGHVGPPVHVSKLFPNRVKYDPQELEQLGDEEASDADEPEYRPPAAAQRPALHDAPQGAAAAPAGDVAAPAPARSRPARAPATASRSQTKETFIRESSEQMVKALDDFVVAYGQRCNNEVSNKVLGELYRLLGLYYGGNSLDEQKRAFRAYNGRSVAELIDAVKELQQQHHATLAALARASTT